MTNITQAGPRWDVVDCDGTRRRPAFIGASRTYWVAVETSTDGLVWERTGLERVEAPAPPVYDELAAREAAIDGGANAGSHTRITVWDADDDQMLSESPAYVPTHEDAEYMR